MANVVREDVVKISFEIADNPLSKVTAEMDKLKASVTGAEGGLDKIKDTAKKAAAGVEGIKGAAKGIENIAKEADKAKEELGGLNQSSEKVKDSGKKFKGVGSSIKEAWSKTKDWAVALKEAASQKFEKLTSGIKKVSGALGKGIKTAAKVGIGALTGGTAAAIAGINNCMTVLGEQTAMETQLATTAKNMGISDEAINSIKDYAGELQKVTMYGDEAMIGAAAEAATYFTDPEAIKGLMKTVTDYAAGMSGGTALSTQEIVDYTTNLAKMTTGAYDAMTKKGFVVTKAQKKILTTGTDMEKVAAIQEIIGESWGGMAESFVNTPTGKLAQMNNLFGDLKEKIGAVFSGKYVSLLGMFTDTLSSLNDIMSDGFQDSDIGDIANTVETLADKGIAGLNKYLPYFMNFAAMAISVLGKSLIKLAPTLAKSFANGLVMMFKSGAAVIKANGPELLSAIKDVVMTAVSGMYEMIVGQPMPEGMFSSIQNAAENVLDGIVGFASGVRDFVGGIISAAGPLIGGLLNLASGVFAFLGKNMDSILPILGFVAGSIMAVVTAQKLAAAATAIETAAQWALNSGLLLCPITRIVASIVALVAVLIIAYNKSETFRTIIDSLGRIIGWVVGKIGEFISGIVDWVKNCEPLQKILSGIKSALSWIGDKVGGVFKKAADGLSGFADSLDGGVAEAAGEKISSGVAKGIENGKGSVEASANDLKSSLSGTFGDLNIPSVDVGDMGIDFASVGTNSAMNFSSGFNAGLTELGGAQDVAVNLTVDQSGLAAASGAVNSFVAETQTAVGQIPQVFDTAMGTASQTVTAKLTEITTSVTSGMAACLSAVQNGLSQIIAAVSAVNLSSAGANMINGLVNGINSRKAAAVAAARGVATAVNAEFNKVQKISSPSKVWQEKGQFLIEGGIIGMEKTMPQMRDTAQAAGEMAIPYSQNYTPESGGGYSTVNSSSSETNNYSPTFNLTINGGSSSDRDLARRVKEWVKEAIADEFDSMSRKRPAPRLA